MGSPGACFADFEAPGSAFLASSGQSLSGDWQGQAASCIALGGRYVLFASGLQESLARGSPYAQELKRVKFNLEKDETDRESFEHFGFCAPPSCSDVLNHDYRSLGWRFLLHALRGHGEDELVNELPQCARVLVSMSSEDDIKMEALKAERVSAPASFSSSSDLGYERTSASTWDPMLRRLPQRGQCGPSEIHVLKNPFHRRVLVDPHRKIAFCLIPKVATWQFRKLFNFMNGFNATNPTWCCGDLIARERPPRERICEWDSVAANYNITRTQLRKPCTGWRFAAFVRDPLDRFLSAFLDKCTLKEDSVPFDIWKSGTVGHEALEDAGFNCMGPPWCWFRGDCSPPMHLNMKVQAFKELVKLLTVEPGVPGWGMERNDHWMLQSKSLEKACGFDVRGIDYLGYLSSDRQHVNKQVFEMLHGTFRFSNSEAKSYADRLFPVKGSSTMADAHHATGAHQHRVLFWTPKTLAGVLSYVKEDYSKLPIDFPSWAKQHLAQVDVGVS